MRCSELRAQTGNLIHELTESSIQEEALANDTLPFGDGINPCSEITSRIAPRQTCSETRGVIRQEPICGAVVDQEDVRVRG